MVCSPKRNRGTKIQAMDWGLNIFATLVDTDGNIDRIAHPMPLKKSSKKLKSAMRAKSRKQKGSKRYKLARRRIASLYEKIVNQRNDFLHKQSAKLIASSSVFITEALDIASIQRDKSKSHGLHRNIADSAPATFLEMLRTKAQEAACEYYEIETKTIKPTQTCSECGNQKQKALKERIHNCECCGFTADRDVNAALVMLKTRLSKSKGLALREVSWKLDTTNRETLSRDDIESLAG